MKLDLNFIAGFVDAEGCFQLGLEKAPKNIIKYRTKLVLDITNKDKDILLGIKETLNFGFVVKTSINTWAFRINTYKDARKFFNLFSNLIIGSAKKDMELFKEALTLVTNRKIETKERFGQFIHLMYASNSKGQSRDRTKESWLKEFNLDSSADLEPLIVKNLDLLTTKWEQNLKTINLSPYYISGYTQGDGSHYLTTGKRVRGVYTLTDLYEPILKVIAREIGFGKVYSFDPKTSENNKICFRYQVDSIKAAIIWIIPHFDKYPLYGEKQAQYELWRKKCLELNEKL